MQGKGIFVTSDGSHSIFSEQFGVSYHSKHGAIQETQHVFIDAALLAKAKDQKKISILDIGFGTGLNAFMSFLAANNQALQLDYTAIEAFPIRTNQAATLNYTEILNLPQEQAHFMQLHECDWNQSIDLSPNFTFIKLLKRFEELDFVAKFDVIYFDAFAPDAQSELWEAPLLSQMYTALKEKGILTTYCAKGVVKRTLKSIGFHIEGIPGPPGKREMTRATKLPQQPTSSHID